MLLDIDKAQEYDNLFRSLRRHFHQIPELGLHEVKTTKEIGRYLREMGITPIPLEPTGITAYIGKSGPVLALRADIDGLAVKEDTGLSYASKHEGLMHACGHDGHVAGLLGAAYMLKQIEEDLKVRVKLIFQPSEENALGARKIIDDGILEDVDAIFGLHLFSDIPYGQISVEEGPRMAQTDRFVVTFKGKGGHAGKPHQCVDSTVMAAEFVLSAQTIVAREMNPVDPAVLTIGSFHSGTQYNIISPEAVLQGTCRSFSLDVAESLRRGIEKRAQLIADIYGGQVSIDYTFGAHPPMINHKAFTEIIARLAENTIKDSRLVHVDPMMLGEDFSSYQVEVPGVFAFVGCGIPGQDVYPNHHPKFDIDERALTDAVALHLTAVEAFCEFINSKN